MGYRAPEGMRGEHRKARPTWQEFSSRMSSGLQCLAMFMALESAEVLAGTKPANLISIVNRTRPCGRNLYELWKVHGDQALGASGLATKELVDRKSSLLLLVYDPQQLQTLLTRRDVTTVLRKAGYTDPNNTAQCLKELAARVTISSFPHEIGVFLGYPLKDVIGFMGWAQLPFTCQGPWKIYGDPTESLKLAESHRHCRLHMATSLSTCRDPFLLLQKRGRARTC